jgi:hypothetical protein
MTAGKHNTACLWSGRPRNDRGSMPAKSNFARSAKSALPMTPKINPSKTPANSRVKPPKTPKKREITNKDAAFTQKEFGVFTPPNSLQLKKKRKGEGRDPKDPKPPPISLFFVIL